MPRLPLLGFLAGSLLVGWAFGDEAAAKPGSPISIGVARVDVTPHYPVRLGGYLARSKSASEAAQPLWVKALAIGGDEQKPVILVSVDNLGVGENVVEDVAKRLEKKVGLERARFTVASSHTHSAPCLTGVAPNIFGKPIPPDEQAAIDRYTRELADAIEKVSLEALRDRKPGHLAWSRGKVGFAENRRTRGGPVDHDLPVLRVTDPSGALRALVINYACHCTTVSPDENKFSGDWAGFAQADMEKDHPGIVAMTVVGCGADSNPARRLAAQSVKEHGRAIANEVNRLLQSTWTALDEPPAAAFTRFSLPFDTLPTQEQLKALVEKGGPPGYNASRFLASLERGEALPTTLPYSAQSWQFGDRLAMVFLPGEVVVDYALRLKRELDASRLWVTAYANDVPCYIPSERILKEGGYEGGGAMVYYARPTRLAPGVEQIILDGVRRVVPASFLANQSASPDMPPPKSPAQALEAFRLKPGLRIELVAAEPLVLDPVAIDFGADGKLWVCEMRDYPTGIDGNWKPGGVVKVLTDTNGDGRYDTGSEFLGDLPFPTGVMAWRKGVLICAAPEIIYAEDTNGDGKADVRQTLFQGFATENYQARVNGLSYGLDNWIYGANGLIGGSIRGLMTGKVVEIGGRDFRIRPDQGIMEPASGLTQQGRVRDDWGNQFGGNNSIWIQHYPLPDHDARRNPFVATPSSSVYVPRDDDSTRLFPSSETLARYNHPESANRVTSACSPLIYRDSLLGPEYEANAFVCEPVHNLVHREVLTPSGVTFAGHRAADEQTREFLSSTDHWFRPVQVRTGPDGALWVVDMYRFVIEHPRWISPDRLASLDVRAGADRGRIYRVVPENRPLHPVPRLASLDSVALAQALEHPSGTVRDNAQRLIVERQDAAAVPTLNRLVREATRPQSRMQALCTLEGLDRLATPELRHGLNDSHPGVRAQAVRLAEAWLVRDRAVGDRVIELADDPSITVRFQVALSLGASTEPRAAEALGRIAARDRTDTWVRAAVLSSSRLHAAGVLEVLLERSQGEPPSTLVEPLIATLIGRGDRKAVEHALETIARPLLVSDARLPVERWRLGAVARILDASAEPAYLAHPAVVASLNAARKQLAITDLKVDDRLAAIRLLGRRPGERERDRETLTELLEPTEPVDVQLQAISRLLAIRDRPAIEVIFRQWNALGPVVRSACLDGLLSRDTTRDEVLSALESKRILPSAIDAAHRQQLLNEGSEALKKRAQAALGGAGISARAGVLERYSSVKSLPGHPETGKGVFTRVCAACHRFDRAGHEVGPDLAALTDTSVDALLTAILDPNREVDARYATYSAALKDGRVVTGLIASETASAIAMKRQEGQLEVLLRTDLEDLRTAGQSLMPEGLENDIKPQELADVIAYVASGANKPKSIEGNRPELVTVGRDGIVRLRASAAEIYGPSLTYETAHENLGMWHAVDDRAAWNFRTDQPGTFTISMEWACADESAGNVFVVQVDGITLRAAVGGTGAGSWSNYRTIFVGEAKLPAGKHRLEFRPAGAVRNALLDLKAVVLTPRSTSVFRTDKP
ncbi:MAG: neutral/alkaline non-lysosomal ceramidase N-terminal domain-containing protein [Isosphaeraceae bacterium]